MPAPAKPKSDRARPRTFSSTDRDFQMLEAVAHYHGTSRSAMVTGLIRKEFWRVFPNGTETVLLDAGAKVSES
ncbi:MAG TPA: hypothetical protein QGF95_26515 [Candidatus Latescibacteria bacterium]|jgi:hypothetical protein|nr:hypothetical protein [Gemmatimonadaceae bacterium]MDP6015132.1 hypothetical protein [Candidatus Latescibacterota bacterium]HJP34118.1 hypothetical protein [Candidatus Latescibacterota bacterium]|tara:strand:- start:227 stop:445 length:219 start_codon:yes stop_codon:yes gene_type:complete